MSYKLRNHNTFVRSPVNSVFNGTETLSYLGPKTWDLVPNEIKQSDSLKSFKLIDSTIVKGKLPYKTITSQNVSSETQIKNFFIS